MMSRNSEKSGDHSLVTTTIISEQDSPSASSFEIATGNNQSYLSRNLLLSKFWQSTNKNFVIYENLCEGCGYGVFEAEGKLCDFCRYAINGIFKETNNIYENICEKCGEIYGGKECITCSRHVEVKRKKSEVQKSGRILGGIFGTLKRVRSRDKTSKPCRKLEIVHNVDGYGNVFRTNETFDLNRICELKRLQSNSENHIYGKLRKSDDHLMNSLKFDRKASATNSKSDSSLHKNSTLRLPITNYYSVPDNTIKAPDKKPSYFILQDHVIEWMTSLRRQTYDYHIQSDDSICNTKSIPSRNFSCCGYFNEGGRSVYSIIEDDDIALRSLLANELDLQRMVDSFKRNLMEKQRSKRRAIYVKVDDKTGTSSAQSSAIDNIKGALLNRSKRNALYENDSSDFVNDLLVAFDTVLNRDLIKSEPNVPEVSTDNAANVQCKEKNTETAIIPLNESLLLSSEKCRRNVAVERLLNDQDVFLKREKLQNIINNVLLSKSLNRIILTYDKQLSAFLTVINSPRFSALNQSRIIKMYIKLSKTTSDSNTKIVTPIIPTEPLECITEPIESITEPTDQTVDQLTKSDEDIYQPIWKFQTIGNPRESYLSEFYDFTINDSSNVEDHSEWETDDEFMFSPKIKEGAIEQESISVASETTTLNADSFRSLYSDSDIYQSVCILYSVKEPKLRAIVYNYDPRRSYFTSHQNKKCNLYNETKQINQQQVEVPLNVIVDDTSVKSERYKTVVVSNSIPVCVQAWKFMLLDVNYLDDEEDMYVCEDDILKHKEIEVHPVGTLQRFKSISTGNLLDIPPDKKKTIGERFRNRLQMGVLKLNSKQPKEKKGKVFRKRPDSASFYTDTIIKPKYPIFDSKLDEVEFARDHYVPRFVADCISIIEQKDSIKIDGLYRASGNKVEIDEVKRKLTENYIYEPKILNDQDIHTITGLLKLFFRELKTPLIPPDIYSKLPENLVDKSNLSIIRDTLREIKNPSRDTLKFLLKHLTVVAHHSTENRMPASNLAIVWGPCILYLSSADPLGIARMNTLTKILIENYDDIFANNERLVS